MNIVLLNMLTKHRTWSTGKRHIFHFVNKWNLIKSVTLKGLLALAVLIIRLTIKAKIIVCQNISRWQLAHLGNV